MKMTLEQTDDVLCHSGVLCDVWKGVMEDGTKIEAGIAALYLEGEMPEMEI